MNTLKQARNFLELIFTTFNAETKDRDFSELKEMLEDLKNHTVCENITLEAFKECIEVVCTAASACDCYFDDFVIDEILDLIDQVGNKEDDFCLDLPCGECRLIDEDSIDEIWSESLLEQIRDCYEIPSNLPDFFCIDWDQTVENCKVDGMGHHFATYDGEEHFSGDYYIFRTN